MQKLKLAMLENQDEEACIISNGVPLNKIIDSEDVFRCQLGLKIEEKYILFHGSPRWI